VSSGATEPGTGPAVSSVPCVTLIVVRLPVGLLGGGWSRQGIRS
jgi:hypothetical protein